MSNKLPFLLRLSNTDLDKIKNNYKPKNPTKKKRRKRKKN